MNEGKKKQVRLKAQCVFTDKLEGPKYFLTPKLHKNKGLNFLIGARVPVALYTLWVRTLLQTIWT
jgi:hypothetical protein